MREAFDHCERLVRDHDKDGYLASLFAPTDKRLLLFGLYAFDLEVSRVPQLVRQPMAGEIRLQWWREVIEGTREEEAHASPVAAALREVVQSHPELKPLLERKLEGIRAELYEDGPRNLDSLGNHADAVRGSIIEAAIHLLCANTPPGAPSFASHAGRVLTLEPLMAAHAGKELRARVEAHLTAARQIAFVMPAETWPAFLVLALAPLRLARMDAGRGRELPQWRRQWTLWRAARRMRF
jgi:phytoene synthase